MYRSYVHTEIQERKSEMTNNYICIMKSNAPALLCLVSLSVAAVQTNRTEP